MNELDLSKLKFHIWVSKEEANIRDYKAFYKDYLISIRNHTTILNRLSKYCIKFQEIFRNKDFSSPEATKTVSETRNLLKEQFDSRILELFEKNIPFPEVNFQSSFSNLTFIDLIQDFTKSIEIGNEHRFQTWAYKTNFLDFLYNCLFHYGLHPDILKRDPKIYKRYNFMLVHTHKSTRKKKESITLLKKEKLEKEYLIPYEHKIPINLGGKLIPFDAIYQIKITSTLLLNDEIELFGLKNRFQWNSAKKDEVSFINLCQDETENFSKNPYLNEKDKAIYRNQKIYFIDPNRIEELQKLKSEKFDLIKLIQLCDELNNATANNTIFAPTMLARAIIDHVPPIFGYTNFTEFANNYSNGTKSFKKSMQNLDKSLRNIADNNIHSQARQKEVLPKVTQTDFTPELDLLLSEIVRILK